MAEAARGCQVEDFFRLKSVSDAQVSPDGSQVAFVVSEIDREGDSYKTAIWAAAADGGTPNPITTAGRNNSQPRWSPDGRWLAFVSGRDGKAAQLQLLPLSGGEARRLTDLGRGVNEIAWSPDSATIAFTAATGGPDIDIKEGAAASAHGWRLGRWRDRLVAGRPRNRVRLGAARGPRPRHGAGSVGGAGRRRQAAPADGAFRTLPVARILSGRKDDRVCRPHRRRGCRWTHDVHLARAGSRRHAAQPHSSA
ncbi:MAG: TolB family protein [Dehalococcoidia bacterium]